MSLSLITAPMLHVLLLFLGTTEAPSLNSHYQLFFHYTLHNMYSHHLVFWTQIFNFPLLCHFLLQIGPNGYYFAIDPNGYVLLHPNLQPKVWHLALCITSCGSAGPCLEALHYISGYSTWLHNNCLRCVNNMQASRW